MSTTIEKMSYALSQAYATYAQKAIVSGVHEFQDFVGSLNTETKTEFEALIADTEASNASFDKELNFDKIFKNPKYIVEAAPVDAVSAPVTGSFGTYYKRNGASFTTDLSNRVVRLVEKKDEGTKNLPKTAGKFNFKLSAKENVELKHLGKITAFKIEVVTREKGVKEFVKSANGFAETKAYGKLKDNYSISFQIESVSGEIYNSETEEGSISGWVNLYTHQLLNSASLDDHNKSLLLAMQNCVCESADDMADESADYIEIYKNVIAEMVNKGVNHKFEVPESKPIFVMLTCEERIANKTHWFELIEKLQLPAGKSKSDFVVENRVNSITGKDEEVILCYHKITTFEAITMVHVLTSTGKGVWNKEVVKIAEKNKNRKTISMMKDMQQEGIDKDMIVDFLAKIYDK